MATIAINVGSVTSIDMCTNAQLIFFALLALCIAINITATIASSKLQNKMRQFACSRELKRKGAIDPETGTFVVRFLLMREYREINDDDLNARGEKARRWLIAAAISTVVVVVAFAISVESGSYFSGQCIGF